MRANTQSGFTITFLLFVNTIAFAQVNRYDSPAQNLPSYQPYQIPYNELKYALEKRQQEYDNAKAYANKLYDYIAVILRKEVDFQLREDLNMVKADLDILYDGDMSRSGNELDKIERRIGTAIDNYNHRIKTTNANSEKIENLKKLMQDKKFNEAINYINTNLLDNSDIDLNYVYGNRAECYMSLQKYTQAASDFTKLIIGLSSSSEDFFLAVNGRAWAYLYSNNYDAGYSDGEQLVKIKPFSNEGYFIMGYALAGQNKRKEAIDKYTESIKMNPSHSMSYNNRGYSKFELGLDINDALKDVNKAIELDAENTSALGSRAEINIKLGKYTDAILDLNKALKIEEDGFNYFLRGNAKIKLNDKLGACSDWSKAGEQNEMKAYDQISKFCK